MDLRAVNAALKMTSSYATRIALIVLLAVAAPCNSASVGDATTTQSCTPDIPAVQSDVRPVALHVQCPLIDRLALRALLRQPSDWLLLDQVGIASELLQDLPNTRMTPAELARVGIAPGVRYLLVGSGKNDLSLAALCGQLFGSTSSVSVLAGGELSLHAMRKIAFQKSLEIDLATALSMPKTHSELVFVTTDQAAQSLLRTEGWSVRSKAHSQTRIPIYWATPKQQNHVEKLSQQHYGFFVLADAQQIATAMQLQQQIAAIAQSPPHIPCYLK